MTSQERKNMMTSLNGNTFRITDPLWEESTSDRWISFTKGQWCGVMFPLMSACANNRINSWEAGELRCPGPWFNIKTSSYQYRKSHCGDKTVVRSPYLQNGISNTGKMVSFYWIRALVVMNIDVPCIMLAHWSRVTHIWVGNPTIIGSDNGLSPGRRQAITWTNGVIMSIGPVGTNFSDILISIHTFSFEKMHLKRWSAKCRQFCLGLNVLYVDALIMSIYSQLRVKNINNMEIFYVPLVYRCILMIRM